MDPRSQSVLNQLHGSGYHYKFRYHNDHCVCTYCLDADAAIINYWHAVIIDNLPELQPPYTDIERRFDDSDMAPSVVAA